MTTPESSQWRCFSESILSSHVVYLSQVVLVYMLVITALVNLTLGNGDSKYWLSVVSAGVAYLLPNPKLQKQ